MTDGWSRHAGCQRISGRNRVLRRRTGPKEPAVRLVGIGDVGGSFCSTARTQYAWRPQPGQSQRHHSALPRRQRRVGERHTRMEGLVRVIFVPTRAGLVALPGPGPQGLPTTGCSCCWNGYCCWERHCWASISQRVGRTHDDSQPALCHRRPARLPGCGASVILPPFPVSSENGRFVDGRRWPGALHSYRTHVKYLSSAGRYCARASRRLHHGLPSSTCLCCPYPSSREAFPSGGADMTGADGVLFRDGGPTRGRDLDQTVAAQLRRRLGGRRPPSRPSPRGRTAN